jgi:hypothetical protein
MTCAHFWRFIAVIEIIIRHTFDNITQYGAIWMRISLRVIWTKTQAQAQYVIFTGFYFIINVQHSATCGRYILLWRDIITQSRSSLHVLTSWSHTVIEIAFVKFIWCMIQEIKLWGRNMQHSLLTSRNIIFLCGEFTYTVEPRFTNVSHHEQIGSWTNFPKKNISVYERCLE